MPAKEKPTEEYKKLQTLDEICENTRAIRRVTNRILDHLHEYQTGIPLPKVQTKIHVF